MTSCKQRHKQHKIHVYKTVASQRKEDSLQAQANNDTFIWWYVMWSNSGSGGRDYYYYSSPTEVTDLTTISWTSGTSVPFDIATTESISTLEIAMSDLPADIQTEIADNETQVSEATEASQGADNETSEAADASSSSDGSSSGGDSGGGDSGGGDSGGGDGD